jgi:hypothetical protein
MRFDASDEVDVFFMVFMSFFIFFFFSLSRASETRTIAHAFAGITPPAHCCVSKASAAACFHIAQVNVNNLKKARCKITQKKHLVADRYGTGRDKAPKVTLE